MSFSDRFKRHTVGTATLLAGLASGGAGAALSSCAPTEPTWLEERHEQARLLANEIMDRYVKPLADRISDEDLAHRDDPEFLQERHGAFLQQVRTEILKEIDDQVALYDGVTWELDTKKKLSSQDRADQKTSLAIDLINNAVYAEYGQWLKNEVRADLQKGDPAKRTERLMDVLLFAIEFFMLPEDPEFNGTQSKMWKAQSQAYRDTFLEAYASLPVVRRAVIDKEISDLRTRLEEAGDLVPIRERLRAIDFMQSEMGKVAAKEQSTEQAR